MSTASFIGAVLVSIYLALLGMCPLFSSKTKNSLWLASMAWFWLVEAVSIATAIKQLVMG